MLKDFRLQTQYHAGYNRLKSLSVRFLPVSIGTPERNKRKKDWESVE